MCCQSPLHIVALLQMGLRSLVAAKRGYPILLKKELITGINTVLNDAKIDPLDPSECFNCNNPVDAYVHASFMSFKPV